MKAHPAAMIFPMMADDELRELAADIKKNGLREPITTYDGKILDGRNRERACRMAKVEPKTRSWRGGGSPIAYVLSLNLQRRHLSQTQRAFAAEKALPLFAAEAKKRMKTGRKGDPDQLIDQGLATAGAAASVGVNRQYVSDAKRVREEAPEIASLAERGSVNMQQAKQLSRLPATHRKRAVTNIKRGVDPRRVVKTAKIKEKQRLARKIERSAPAAAKGRFDVIAIDPPWQYDTNIERSNQRGLVTYPDMTLDQICALPVAKLAARDCVLFLWTTNAFVLRGAPACLDAWGFKEKTMLTWDKVNIGTGHWLRNVTEHCILAVRGTPSVDLTSQSTIIHEKRREPSRKPDAFYKLVRKLCAGRRLEMFSREERPGFTAWGAETGKFSK